MAGLATVLAGAQQFVSLAVPYKWGGTPTGTTASTLATDCSGMIQFLYAQIGVALPRTSQEQASSGTQVASGPQTAQSMANLQPGDLIFYNYDGPNSHVALYAGNGQQYAETTTGTTASLQPVDFSSVSSVRQIVSDPGFLSSLGSSGGSSSGSGAPPTYTEGGNAAYAYNFFVAQGLSPLAASAVVGNLMQESGVNPEAKQSGGPGVGLAQWTNGLIRAGSSAGQQATVTGNNAADLQAQLSQMWSEMNAPQYASSLAILKSASGTASQVALSWGQLYEGFGVAGNRGTYANQVYQLATATANGVTLDASTVPAELDGWTQWITNPLGAAFGVGSSVGQAASTASGIAGDLSGLSGLLGDITSGAFWGRILLFLGGGAVFTVGLIGFMQVTGENGKIAQVASDAASAAKEVPVE